MARKLHGYVLFRVVLGDFDMPYNEPVAMSENRETLVTLKAEKTAQLKKDDIDRETKYEISERFILI